MNQINRNYLELKYCKYCESEIPYQIVLPIVNSINLVKNENLSELIGIILGDGHLSKNGNTLTITLNFIDEEKYVFYVIDLLHKTLKTKPSIVNLPNNKANQIRIYGKAIVDELVKLGLKKGNKIKNQIDIPRWIKNNKEFSITCLRGLFDTDGSIHLTSNKKRLGINFKNNSKPLVINFKELCDRLEIHTNKLYKGWTMSRGKQFRHYKIEITKQDQIKSFLTIVRPKKWLYKKRYFIDILKKNNSKWIDFFET